MAARRREELFGREEAGIMGEESGLVPETQRVHDLSCVPRAAPLAQGHHIPDDQEGWEGSSAGKQMYVGSLSARSYP